MNKPKVFKFADQFVQDDHVVWLDADTLVTAPPNQLSLFGSEQIAMCSPFKEIASSGPNDPFEAYWQALGTAIKIPTDSIPWITSKDGAHIRAYWNSGIVSFKNGCKIGATYDQVCRKIIESRVFSKVVGFHYMDQVALPFVVAELKLNFRNLTKSHNSHILYEYEKFSKVVTPGEILHYHDGLWPKKFDGYIALLSQTRPDVAEWLKQKGPLQNQGSLLSRIFLKCLKKGREFQYKRYLASSAKNI